MKRNWERRKEEPSTRITSMWDRVLVRNGDSKFHWAYGFKHVNEIWHPGGTGDVLDVKGSEVEQCVESSEEEG